jgi:membrane protein DedA with SNARE-associated domain
MKNKNILAALAIPLGLLGMTLLYSLIWRLFNLPKEDELIKIITEFFNRYGLWVVLISSIIEGALIIGNYFPGGVVVFLGVIAAGHNIPKIILTVSVVVIGFFIGYLLDYVMGKYGWYKVLIKFGMKDQLEKAKLKLSKQSFNAIFLSYWEPNLGSVTATAAGILNIPLPKFLFESLIGLVIWDAFWGALVATLGKQALNLVTNLTYIIPIVVIWIVLILVKERFYKKVDV